MAARLEEALLNAYPYGAKVPTLQLRDSPTADLRVLADFVYAQVFASYTRKQWGMAPEALDPGVTARVPVVISRDDRYFQDPYQGMPAQGYTAMIRRMLDHAQIGLLLQTDYHAVQQELTCRGVIYTGPIDAYFGYRYGPLPYRSLRFHFEHRPLAQYQAVGTVNYPNEYDFTRITEQKLLTGQAHPGTTLLFEYPQAHEPGSTIPYYPVPTAENQTRYQQYQADAETLRGRVWFAGRLGAYRYLNMDQAVERALTLFETEIAAS